MSSLKNLVKTRTYRERSQAQGDNYSKMWLSQVEKVKPKHPPNAR